MNKETTFEDREAALEDALPDLVVGLIGIPIALSLQKVVEVALHQPDRQCEGFTYFVLIILLYGLYSGGLCMLFEVGQRLTRRLPDPQRERVWERYLVLRVVAVGPTAVFVVGTLSAIGIGFENPYVQFLRCSVTPKLVTLLSFVGPMSSYALTLGAERLSVLILEYPIILPYYTLALTTAFVVTCALLL